MTSTVAVNEGPTGSNVARLLEWAEAAGAARDLGGMLCKTAFCPTAYRGKPDDAGAAILAGSEVGLSPLAALQAFDIIEGRAAPRAITLRAIVQSFGHDIEVVTSDANHCVMRGRRGGRGEWQEVRWDMGRAAHLAGKDNWRKQPTAMLVARATSEIARLVAADALLGIPYSVEELQDEAGTFGPVVDHTRPVAERSVFAQTAPVAAKVTVVNDAPTATVPAPGVVLISNAQMKDLQAAARKLKIGGPADVLAYANATTGRPVPRLGDLTAAEAEQVITALNADANTPGTDVALPGLPDDVDPNPGAEWGKK